MVFARAADAGPFQRVYLDPPTGRVLDSASGRDWLGWLHSFHESLTLREYNGREIVGAVGIAMLISSLSGDLPVVAGAAGCARAPSASGAASRCYRNLHYTFGIWGALVLAMLSFTGVFLAYPDAGRTVVRALRHGLAVAARAARRAEAAGRRSAPDEAVAIAQAASIRAPSVHRSGAAGRSARRLSRQPARTRRHRAALDHDGVHRSALARDPAGTGSRDARTRGDGFLLWQRILHEGGAFGGSGSLPDLPGGPAATAADGHRTGHVAAHAEPTAGPRRRGVRRRGQVASALSARQTGGVFFRGIGRSPLLRGASAGHPCDIAHLMAPASALSVAARLALLAVLPVVLWTHDVRADSRQILQRHFPQATAAAVAAAPIGVISISWARG